MAEATRRVYTACRYCVALCGVGGCWAVDPLSGTAAFNDAFVAVRRSGRQGPAGPASS